MNGKSKPQLNIGIRVAILLVAALALGTFVALAPATPASASTPELGMSVEILPYGHPPSWDLNQGYIFRAETTGSAAISYQWTIDGSVIAKEVDSNGIYVVLPEGPHIIGVTVIDGKGRTAGNTVTVVSFRQKENLKAHVDAYHCFPMMNSFVGNMYGNACFGKDAFLGLPDDFFASWRALYDKAVNAGAMQIPNDLHEFAKWEWKMAIGN